jgi:HEAT repeat protein
VVNALLGLARDAGNLRFVRDQSVSAIYRLPRGDGIAPLLDVIRAEPDSPLARYALSTIAPSGDPRVRAVLRELAQRANAPDSVRLIAVQGLGRYLASAQDVALLRSLYAGMNATAAKTAIISAVGDFGGAENARWLLALGMDANEDPARRRSALQAANRAEAPIAEFVAAYDRSGDRATREELMAIYSARGDRAAIDKLIAIARSDTDPALRKSAINRLSRSDDPRVAAVLRELAIPR